MKQSPWHVVIWRARHQKDWVVREWEAATKEFALASADGNYVKHCLCQIVGETLTNKRSRCRENENNQLHYSREVNDRLRSCGSLAFFLSKCVNPSFSRDIILP
jgi:hypothetical protein